MGGKVSLQSGNSWTRINRVLHPLRREDVDDHLDEDVTQRLLEDDLHFNTTACVLTRWRYRLHRFDKTRKEEGLGLQALIGSQEGSVRFFTARDPALDGKHFGHGVDPWLAPGTLELRTTRRKADAHQAAVTSVSASEDGRVGATSSKDKTVMLWNLDDAERIAVCKGHEGEVTCVVVASDGSMCLSGGDDFRLMLWDATDGTRKAVMGGRRKNMDPVLAQMSLKEKRDYWKRPRAILHDDAVSCLCLPHLAPYTCAASGSRDKTILHWDLTTGKATSRIEGHEDYLTWVSYMPGDGGRNTLVSASLDKTCRLWDIRTGGEAAVLRGHRAGVTSCGLTTDVELGTLLFSGSWDGEVKVWDMRKMTERITHLGHYDSIKTCSVVGDGEYMLTVGQDQQTRLWRTRRFVDFDLKMMLQVNAGLVPSFLKIRFDEEEDILGAKHAFTRKSQNTDEKGEFAVSDPVFQGILPHHQAWVIHQHQRTKKLDDDQVLKNLELSEDYVMEVLKPLSESELIAQAKRMQLQEAKREKEERQRAKEERAKKYGLGAHSPTRDDQGVSSVSSRKSMGVNSSVNSSPTRDMESPTGKASVKSGASPSSTASPAESRKGRWFGSKDERTKSNTSSQSPSRGPSSSLSPTRSK